MLPPTKYLLSILAVLFSVYGFASLMAVNSICREGPVDWRCKQVDSCNTLTNDDTVQVCGFNGKPLVCCPPPDYRSSGGRRPDNERNDRFNNSSSRN